MKPVSPTAGEPEMRRAPRRTRAAMGALLTAPLLVTGVLGAGAAAAESGSAPTGANTSNGWEMATTDPFSADYHPTFTGNGNFAARVPAQGQGYSAADVATQFQVAGLYAAHLPNEARASAPAWTGLTVSDGSGSFDQAFSAPCVVGSICQLEDAQLSGGVSVASDHGGYQGSGFTQGWGNASAGALLYANGAQPDAAYDLIVRYAAGNPGDNSANVRSLHVSVGDTSADIALPPSPQGDWDTWMQARLPLGALTDRAALTLSCSSTPGADCRVNVDSIAIVPRDGALPTTPPDLTMDARGLADYRQSLDVSTGAIITSARWTSPSGNVSDVAYTVLTDRGHDDRALVRVDVTPQWSGDLEVTDVLDTRPATFVAGTVTHRDDAAGTIGVDAAITGSGITASIASTLAGPGQRAEARPVGLPSGSIAQKLTQSVESGKTYSFVKYVGLTTTHDGADTAGLAKAASTAAAAQGYDAVRASNDGAWADIWKGDIQVTGDDALQQQIRASRFYLLASVNADRPWSPSPAGLSSDGYGGHVFWDTETWMWPSLVAQDPEIAAAVLKYRSDRIDDARANAAAGGHDGIRFPWEGALDGTEQTTATLFGETEQHITADVALAFWQYYLSTGDRTWLQNEGWPVISGAADFWASRVELGDDGQYHINGVTPPDEWAGKHDDSAYTNVAAAQTMRMATRAAGVLGTSAKPAWQTIADKMFMPHDDALGITPEYAGYNGHVIKQADVVMTTYPWGYEQSDELTARNLAYYASRVTTSGGPSMTDAIHSIVSAELGNVCDAWYYTQQSGTPFMRAPFDQFSEEREGGAFTFTTGAGGFLQEFYYGYTGLRMQEDGITLAPILPPSLTDMTVAGLHYQGRTFDVKIGTTSTDVTLTSGPALTVHTADGDKTVSTDAALRIPTRTANDCEATSGYGTLLGSLSAPAGGDNGAGTLQYPGSSNFPTGTFDMTDFDVYRDGDTLRYVTTVSGEITNPWGGNGMSVQLLHTYLRLPSNDSAPARSGAVPALPGTNADLESPWDLVLVGNGRATGSGPGTGLYDASGALVAPVELSVTPRRHQIVLSFPESALKGADPVKVGYVAAMLVNAESNEGLSNIRPALDCEAPGSPDWVSQWRICGGLGTISSASPYDTDTRDPNIIKVFVPEGRTQQGDVLKTEGPSILPFVALKAAPGPSPSPSDSGSASPNPSDSGSASPSPSDSGPGSPSASASASPTTSGAAAGGPSADRLGATGGESPLPLAVIGGVLLLLGVAGVLMRRRSLRRDGA
nr:dextran alpha-1,2-debranching enzyme [Microbacterium dextranolyticum]